jgi:hypothetical protein
MTARQFLRALNALRRRDELTDCDIQMLAVMVRLGKQPVSALRYARAMGWDDYRGANGCFGRLASRIWKNSGCGGQRPEYWVEAIFDTPGESRIFWNVKSHLHRVLPAKLRTLK